MLSVSLLALALQAPAPSPPEGLTRVAATPPESAPATPATKVGVDELRARIHGMRLDLLFGGDKVKSAEGEAIGFYNQRIESVNKSLDGLETDLAEKRASYDMALEQSLEAGAGAPALQRAQALRAEIAGLEHDADDLASTRTNLGKLVQTVQARQRERDILAARMNASSAEDLGAGFTLGSVGLAPDVQVRPDVSPFDDELLVQDLFARDPVAAARTLYAADPERYRREFPLRPPAQALRKALVFPLPDLPGGRP